MAEEATKEQRIASGLADLMTGYYGHGPTRARGIVHDDVVMVILEETFSMAEKTLIERGDHEDIQRIRRRFQTVMAEDFKTIVEQEMGRTVTTFISDTDIQSRVSVEVFLLGDPKTNMEAFEEEETQPACDRSNEPKERG